MLTPAVLAAAPSAQAGESGGGLVG